MTDEEKTIEKRIMPWRFWFYMTFSILTILAIIFYFPLRFQHQAIANDDHMNMPAMHGGGGHTENVTHEETDIKEGVAINLSLFPTPVHTGVSTELDFFVNLAPYGLPVPPYELEFNHTKLMHVIGIRSDMNEFFHIHPVPSATTPGHFNIPYTFANQGLYKIWSEVQKDGINHTVGHKEIAVAGEGSAPLKEVFFSNSAIVASPNGNFQVLFNHPDPVGKNQEVVLSFEIHDAMGQEVGLEQYLGADMHLTIIRDDWKQFIHTHPENGSHAATILPSLIPFAHANGTHTESPATPQSQPQHNRKYIPTTETKNKK